MSGQHAPLPPSSAEQWGNCSGWFQATLNDPKLDTPESQRGTAAHLLASKILQQYKDGQTVYARDFVGVDIDGDGTLVDEEMAEGVQIYVDDVLSVVTTCQRDFELLVEYGVNVPQIHASNWGTLDAALLTRNKNGSGDLYIWDYKNGHREVSAKENLQLINYALGVANNYKIDGNQDQHLKVHIRIVQPFAYRASGPVDEWVVTLANLRGYVNKLHDKAHEAFSNPLLSSGTHCRDCSAVGRCSAARQSCYNLIDVVNRPYLMDEMKSQDLAVERQILADGLVVLKARASAIEDELIHRVSSGDNESGLALKTTEGRLEWTTDPDTAAALAGQFGVNITKKAVLTPTQSIKAIPAKMRPNYLKVLPTITRRPAGKMKLINADESITAKAFKLTQESK